MWSGGPGTADTTETRMTLPTHSQTRNVLRTLPCHQGACRLLSDILDFWLFPQSDQQGFAGPAHWSVVAHSVGWGRERRGTGDLRDPEGAERLPQEGAGEGERWGGQVPER